MLSLCYLSSLNSVFPYIGWFGRSQDLNFETFCGFAADDTLVFKQKNDGSTSGQYVTNRQFRDISAWYHFVVIMDTTQGTADDRCKVYINGERITASTDILALLLTLKNFILLIPMKRNQKYSKSPRKKITGVRNAYKDTAGRSLFVSR